MTLTPVTIAAAIRCTGPGTWAVLDDAGHTPLGGLTVTAVTSQYIRVDYPPVARICSLQVSPDETLALDGLTVGASAGLTYAIIKGRLASGPFNPLSYGNTSANLWVHGLMLAEAPPSCT